MSYKDDVKAYANNIYVFFLNGMWYNTGAGKEKGELLHRLRQILKKVVRS